MRAREHAVRDRAAVASVAVTQIVATALRRWNAGDPTALGAARAEITDYLRDEFHDIARMTRDEIRSDDGADTEQLTKPENRETDNE